MSNLLGRSGRKISRSIRKIDYKILSFILRTRYREIYSEKYKIDVEIDNREDQRLNIAELNGKELEEEIAKLEMETAKMFELMKDLDSPDPFQ